MIPHITDEIKARDLCRAGDQEPTTSSITEIGGTVGDIECLPFLEAIRQFRYDIGREHVLFVHLTLVPYLEAAGELKTKPTQHSVRALREIGIQPDILICRTELPLGDGQPREDRLFCNVEPELVFEDVDADDIYQIPLVLRASRARRR